MIIKPINAADPAAIKTALAPTSLLILANSCCSGLARSTIASSAVLMNSAVQTMAIAMMINAQSYRFKPNHSDTPITAMLTTAWIQALRWVRMTYHQPPKAYRKESERDLRKLIIGLYSIGLNNRGNLL